MSDEFIHPCFSRAFPVKLSSIGIFVLSVNLSVNFWSWSISCEFQISLLPDTTNTVLTLTAMSRRSVESVGSASSDVPVSVFSSSMCSSCQAAFSAASTGKSGVCSAWSFLRWIYIHIRSSYETCQQFDPESFILLKCIVKIIFAHGRAWQIPCWGTSFKSVAV